MNKKIAIFCLHYGGVTGSEMYFYEIIKILKDDFDISIFSNIDYSFKDKTIFDNVNYYNLKESEISNSYDILLLSHGHHMTNNIQKHVINYSTVPIINIIHSEVLPQETPLPSNLIEAYIGIRESIIDYLIDDCHIPNDKIKLIYNPIDTERFNNLNLAREKYGIFIGTMNHLRINPFVDFIDICNKYNLDVKYIGDIDDSIKSKFSNVEFITPTWNIEYLIKKSNLVGGIINGRSYWESKLCMKDTLEYTVDTNGNIISKKFEKNINCDHVKNKNVKAQFLFLLSSILDKS